MCNRSTARWSTPKRGANTSRRAGGGACHKASNVWSWTSRWVGNLTVTMRGPVAAGRRLSLIILYDSDGMLDPACSAPLGPRSGGREHTTAWSNPVASWARARRSRLSAEYGDIKGCSSLSTLASVTVPSVVTTKET